MARVADGTIQFVDPRSNEEFGSVACTSADGVGALVDKARNAQQLWQDLGLKRRKWAVADLQAAFLGEGQALVDALQQECGRPPGESWAIDVVANIDLFQWWLKHCDGLLAAQPIDFNPLNYMRKRGGVHKAPRGVIGLITPWNFPIAIPLRAIVPALLSGNTVVWKPSEHCAHTSALLAKIFAKVLPDNVITLVQGDGEQGAALTAAPIDSVIFTGSVATGRKIGVAAAQRFIPASLELGSKDSAIVLADAPMDRTIEGIVWNANNTGGQNCASLERCYVHRSIYDEFLKRLVARTQQLRPLLDIPPLVNPTQLAHVKAQVDGAVAAGAKLQCGGAPTGDGNYFPPTVLTDVPEDCDLWNVETFGPVLPITPFDDLEAALASINSTPYGLGTSIWTADLDLGEALAHSLRAGVVNVNNHGFAGAVPSAAWTGPGHTGGGVTNSAHCLEAMTRPRTIIVDSLTATHENWWYPYNGALEQIGRSASELNRRGGNKLQAIQGALSGLINRWKAP